MLVSEVIDPNTDEVDTEAWPAWWATWSQSVQQMTDLLTRAPANANSCPD